jgi:radical SAM superfamily enzyme YgiQ (UPF0313 family)
MHPGSSDLTHLTSCAPQLCEQLLHRYDAAGITPGRGCTASCGFRLYAKTAQRKRAMEDVLDEIQALAERVKNIHFLDPDLPSTRSWTEIFCQELIKRKLSIRWPANLRPEEADPELLRLFRRSGCEELLVSVEILDPFIRKKVGEGQTPQDLRACIKTIRDAGIKPVLFFYIGLRWDSEQSLSRIKQFLQEVPLASCYLKQVRPWPGTPIDEIFVSLGLTEKEPTVQDFVNSGSPLCPTFYLSKEEIEE